ncbi:hypothetical protein Zm00014a_041949 [Zea mays]|uniref:Uncharacterized protein n=2 Tax=Zea mays TaxID=4577 RepID=A0A3L6DP74_MAIZE|nr:hypothetical protein [Zea mays]PWZ10464.1 hypothetical protein Zm00014a_041949 [Zea mays]
MVVPSSFLPMVDGLTFHGFQDLLNIHSSAHPCFRFLVADAPSLELALAHPLVLVFIAGISALRLLPVSSSPPVVATPSRLVTFVSLLLPIST